MKLDKLNVIDCFGSCLPHQRAAPENRPERPCPSVGSCSQSIVTPPALVPFNRSTEGSREVSFRPPRARSSRDTNAWLRNNPHIKLEEPASSTLDVKLLVGALKQVGQTCTGRDLLDALGEVMLRNNLTLTITFEHFLGVHVIADNRKAASNGVGSNATLNANLFELSTNHTKNAAAIYRELVHAYHVLNGEAIYRAFPRNGALERARIIGLGMFSGERFSENLFRKENGLEPLKIYTYTQSVCDSKYVYQIDDSLNIFLGRAKEIQYMKDGITKKLENPILMAPLIPLSIACHVLKKQEGAQREE